MVRLLARDTTARIVLFKRRLPPCMLPIDHIPQSNLFPLQHIVQRRRAILKALYHISKGFWFSPTELIMTALFHFEDKVHRRNLTRAESTPLMFLRLLCQVLEHIGFPTEPRKERRRDCEAILMVHTEENQVPVSSVPTPLPTASTSSAPLEPSAPSTTTAIDVAGSSISAPPPQHITISTQDFLAIMDAVRPFSVTSTSFVTAHTALAKRMTRTEATLTHNQAILMQIQSHLGLPPISTSVPAQASSVHPPSVPTPSAELVPLASLDVLEATAVAATPPVKPHPVQDKDDSPPATR